MATAKGQANGYGSTQNRYVFKVYFNYPLSSKVRYEAYDNTVSNFPTTGSDTTTDNNIFGIYATSLSMIGLRDTTNGTAGVGTGWFPAATNPNTATINLLKGTSYYVTQQGATLLSAGGSITWNMQILIPFTAQTNDNTMAFDLALRYTFNSTTPTLTWYFNDEETGGTDATPSWATMPPDSWGIRHSRDGTSSAGPWLANIPVSGSEKTQEGWVTTG